MPCGPERVRFGLDPSHGAVILMDLDLAQWSTEECSPTMSKRSLGSLADLAKILEEASNPESEVREDRREAKPKPVTVHRTGLKQTRVLDPKRKAWYEKRLREQAESAMPMPVASPAPESAKDPAVTKAAAVRLGTNLMETLAAAKDMKPKTDQKKAEPWRRKPGDPIF
jgi:hypothetical protein